MKEPKYYEKMKQGSDEWLSARLKIVTASKVKDLLTAKHAMADNKGVQTYAFNKAYERETGRYETIHETWDMQRGGIEEIIARDIYTENYDDVKEAGFVTREFNGFKIGASPDGLVGEDGGIEIKSRISKFQFEVILADLVPAEYLPQIQTCLLVTGRKWWDYVQYSNGLPLYVKRVYPDLAMHRTIITAAGMFEKRVNSILEAFEENSKNLVKTEYQEICLDGEITGA